MTRFSRLGRTASIGTAAILLLSGCATAVDPVQGDHVQGDHVQGDASVAAFAHIHALEIDPATDELLVATHEGIYAIDIASASTSATVGVRGPLGGLDFDPMGFTVFAGSFYASGHPGPATPAEFGGPNLGLIRSDDGGESWTSVSLKGQTDFHAVTVGMASSLGGLPIVYGLDSSTSVVRRSDDGGLSWRDGATVAARTILADPLAADTVYATTADGFAVSIDGGATFAVDGDAPSLYLVAAASSGELVGIDTTATLWRRDSAGAWTSAGAVSGTPEALTMDGERLYVADDRGIAYTNDNGATWLVLDVTE